MTHFVVRTRRLLGRDVIVPVEWIAEVASDRVLLKADAEGLDRLPVYRDDEAIDGDLERMLSRDVDLHRSGRPLLSISVRDGIVKLRGYVPDERTRARAEAIVIGTRGVRGIGDRLVVDEDLKTRVARALADDDRTRPFVIRVHARHGIVYLTGVLEGTVASVETLAAAEEIAADVAGVRAVVVQVPGISSGESPILPGVGLPVHATDGRLGQLELVVMEPRSRRVTHLVVVGHLPSGRSGDSEDAPPRQRCMLVPAVSVSRVSEQAIFLRLDLATAGRFPEYRADDFQTPERGWRSTFDYRREDVRFEIGDRSTSRSSDRTWMGMPRG